MTDNSATLTWLVIIGICSLTQTLVLIGVLAVVWRRMQAAEARIHAVERDIIAPTLARVELTLRDLQDAAERLRSADDAVREWVARGKDVVSLAVSQAETHVRPVLGLVKGMRAAARVWARGRSGPVAVDRSRVTAMPDPMKEGEHAHVWTK
ncbi:MAG: hypothetical protein ABI634_01885 [Acidobacteriota bacterium]